MKAVGMRTPDLMVLDLGLPDIEGAEVCRRVRATSALPIIVLSARGADADKVAALDLGADDYVTKPFSPEELLARIRVALAAPFPKTRPTWTIAVRRSHHRLRSPPRRAQTARKSG